MDNFDEALLVSRIRRTMESRGITMTEAAEAIGVPYRTLQNQLNGKSRMPIGTFAKLVSFLGVPLEFIIDGRISLSIAHLAKAIERSLGSLLPSVDSEGRMAVPSQPDNRPDSERLHHARFIAADVRSQYELVVVSELDLPID